MKAIRGWFVFFLAALLLPLCASADILISEVMASNGFFESGQKQSLETGGFTSIFKRADGGLNWKLISILLLILLVVVGIVAVAAKVVITFWPVILIMLVISLIFSRTGGGR